MGAPLRRLRFCRQVRDLLGDHLIVVVAIECRRHAVGINDLGCIYGDHENCVRCRFEQLAILLFALLGPLLDLALLGDVARDEDSFVIVYARDITEQREVEERAKESEEQYRQIVEMASEGIWAMDAEYRTTFVNPQMARMLGYEVDQVIGHAVTDFMFEEDLATQGAAMREISRQQSGGYEARLRRKDGVEVWASLSS